MNGSFPAQNLPERLSQSGRTETLNRRTDATNERLQAFIKKRHF